MGIATLFLEYYLLDFLGIGKNLLCGLVINDKFIYQCALVKERILAEQMQLVELYGIYAAFNVHCRFQSKRFLLLERQQLHTHAFDVIQFLAAELFKEHLRVRFKHTIGTHSPTAARSRQIGEIEHIIAVIDNVSLETRVAEGFLVHRQESEHHIQTFTLGTFGRTVRDYGFKRFVILDSRLCRSRSIASLHIIVLRLLRCSLLLEVILISIYRHAFAHVHRNLKAVGILNKYNILAAETGHHSTATLVYKSNFISYLHMQLSLLFSKLRR